MLRQSLEAEIGKSLGKCFKLEHPAEEQFGDFSCNGAMVMAKEEGKSPRELAEEVKSKLEASESLGKWVEKIEVAGPGFINFFLRKEVLVEELSQVDSEYGKGGWMDGKRVVVEYTDPNPFKEFHIGHLMDNAIGESVARLLIASGAKVQRVIYQGDVGMHVAKSIWGLREKMKKEGVSLEELAKSSLEERAKFMGAAYAVGAGAFEESETAKEEMKILNKKIYERSDEEINDLYDRGRSWSLEYFEAIYRILGTKFDEYYFESESGKKGMEVVEKGLEMGILEKSEGAVVFKGEKYGLHTRVFVNALGLPTYEAKDLGLPLAKEERWPYDLSVILTGNEINEYFKVVLKVLSLIRPDLASITKHLSHGMLKLSSGKMSSRTGQVVAGMGLIEQLTEAVEEKMKEKDEKTAQRIAVAAIKMAILKQGIGKDVVFDVGQSLSLEGDSGPYIQYANVRTKAVLAKASESKGDGEGELNGEELALLRYIYRFPEVVEEAAKNYAPNLVCGYLFELAKRFNGFYNQHKIVGGENEMLRLRLTKATGRILENGLNLLGIETVERM